MSAGELDALSVYGCNVGLAFQIVDDLLDETATSQALGKPAGSDRARNKLTYVSVYGMDLARQRATDLVEEAVTALETLKGSTDRLAELAQFIAMRTQ